MQRGQNWNATLLLGLAFASVFAGAGGASGQDAMNVRPGFGYAMHFMSGADAAALLPVPRQEVMLDRPGFGYAMHFMSGADAAALLPVPRQEVMLDRPGFGYTMHFMTGSDAEALLPTGWTKQQTLSKQPQG